jgi:hypothetical protein
MNLKHLKLSILFLSLLLFAASSWAMDAEEDEDAAPDTTSETEDDAAGSDGNFPPLMMSIQAKRLCIPTMNPAPARQAAQVSQKRQPIQRPL